MDNMDQFVLNQVQHSESDLTLACFQEIDGKPTRERIIEKLPPLGKAALAYDPEKDDFFELQERFKVPLSNEEYIDFVNSLFFNMLEVHYTVGGNDSFFEKLQERANSYICWYHFFGFESQLVLKYKNELKTKNHENKVHNGVLDSKEDWINRRVKSYVKDISTMTYGYHVHGWFYECLRKILGNNYLYTAPNESIMLKMADDFFEKLPYNTGRLINKLIVEATGEYVDLPFKVTQDHASANISIDNPFPIYVYTKVCHCIKCEQKYGVKTICDRKAIVQTAKKQWVTIGIQYCQGCNSGFINQEILDIYNKKYGHLLFERSYSDAEKSVLAAKGLAKDSILSRCGYSVEKGTTKEYRQDVLAYILDSHKATKAEIQELLSFFIRFHKQPNFANACRCWKEDLSFVVNYKIDRQQIVGKAIFKNS